MATCRVKFTLYISCHKTMAILTEEEPKVDAICKLQLFLTFILLIASVPLKTSSKVFLSSVVFLLYSSLFFDMQV